MNEKFEKYGLSWPGKREALITAQSHAIFEFDRFPGDMLEGDLLISGDNLEAMKALETRLSGKVDFIYIDPPYNSGKNFVYRNDFSESRKDHSRRTGEDSSADGRRHSAWLSMMYPGLFVARKMLSEHGVIYVSIDQNELHNLILIMNEIFGEENQAGVMTWVKKKKGSHLSRGLRCITEFVLAYAKDAKKLDLYGEDAYTHKWQPLLKRYNKERILRFKENSVESTLSGSFYTKGAYGKGGTKVELLDDINIKDGRITNAFAIKARTVWTQEKLDEEIALGTRVSIRSMGMGPNVFRHDQLTKKKRPPTLLDGKMKIGTNEDAWQEIRKILGTDVTFAYPKPVSLVKYLLSTQTKVAKTGICLDFFAGTGTTGQAVWELNREDGGTRKFILIQSPEVIKPPIMLTDGTKIETMADLCRERLKRVRMGEGFREISLAAMRDGRIGD